MEWLLGKTKSTIKVTVTLQPDESAKSMSGFQSGKPLTCSGLKDETLQSIIDKFNTYRGPDQQILQVWKPDGSSIPFSTVLTEDMTVIVKANTNT